MDCRAALTLESGVKPGSWKTWRLLLAQIPKTSLIMNIDNSSFPWRVTGDSTRKRPPSWSPSQPRSVIRRLLDSVSSEETKHISNSAKPRKPFHARGSVAETIPPSHIPWLYEDARNTANHWNYCPKPLKWSKQMQSRFPSIPGARVDPSKVIAFLRI